MTTIIFGTTERRRAFEYIKRAYPNHIINEENTKEMLDLVSNGKIRIGDPMMYNEQCPVFLEDQNDTTDYMPVYKRFKSSLELKKTEGEQ